MDKNEIINHFELIARDYDQWKERNHYYYDHLKSFFKTHVRSEHRIIEYGCGTGDILAAMDAKEKVGLDIAGAMIHRAETRHPNIRFYVHDCETRFEGANRFDIAILADIIDHITDVLKLFASVNNSLNVGGRMLISTANPLWDPILRIAEKLGQKMPEGEHNFIPNRDLINFLRLRGFRLVESGAVMLVPKQIPGVSGWLNRLAPNTPVINRFCVVQTIVAEKETHYLEDYRTDMTCSVIISCHGDGENITRFSRIPTMGKHTEILVVADRDRTGIADAVGQLAGEDSRVKLIPQTTKFGSRYAIKQGMAHATGDIVMILSEDLTVMPEELPLFFRPIADGIADFVNGTRMIYPVKDQPMRFLHLLGNFFFSFILSWLMAQRISDTLCSTKAVRRVELADISMHTDDRMPLDLLFGAAENGLSIAEIPVHTNGTIDSGSAIRTVKRCLILLKACFQGILRLKLKPWQRTHHRD